MKKTLEITKAVTLLREGGLVAFPTETVYGLGADASNETAVRKIFAAKGRPYDHPLIVHLASSGQLDHWVQQVPPEARVLANTFWPGALTIVLKKQPHVLDIVTGGQDTVAVRVPSHPLALALLSEFGGGVVAPSANRFTRISPTSAQAVEEELGEKVDLILDGGACSVGLESTIIDMSGSVPVILRPGMITAKAISDALGRSNATKHQGESPIRAPGRHHLHYAPTTQTVLMATEMLSHFLEQLRDDDLPLAVMTHSHVTVPHIHKLQQIKMPADAKSYAHDLYDTLRSLDHQHLKQIVIENVPEGVEWEAIRDRLTKASGLKEI